MRDELRKIDEAKAAGEWDLVKLWEQKGNKDGVIIYCKLILEQYPHTSYAARARQKLEQLEGKKPRKAAPALGRHPKCTA